MAERDPLRGQLARLDEAIGAARERKTQHSIHAHDWAEHAHLASLTGNPSLQAEALAQQQACLSLGQAAGAEVARLVSERAQVARQIASLEGAASPAVRASSPRVASLAARGAPLLPLAEAPRPLLGGRLLARLPADAAFTRRHVGGVMGMDISALRELRVWVERPMPWGPARMLLLCLDRFERLDRPVEQIAERERAGLARSVGCAVELLSTPHGALLAPVSLAQERNDIILGCLFVPHPDQTFLRVELFTDPRGARSAPDDLEACFGLVASLIEPGPRPLDLRPRAQAIDLGGGRRMLVDLPADVAWDTDEGPDFAVHLAQRVGPVDEDAWKFRVYVGHHPNPNLRAAPGQPLSAARGVVFGAQLDWRTQREDDAFSQEILVAIPGDDRVAHLFSTTATEGEALQVREVLASLRVEV